MKFKDLIKVVEEVKPQLLDEKYFSYSIPTSKTKEFGGMNELTSDQTNKYMMYDFYVLDYLNFLVDNMPAKQFRELAPDLEDSVKDAVKKLFPHLREELLNAVFYAVCAEMRNSTNRKENLNFFEAGSKERKLYNSYVKYMKTHRGDYTPSELEILDIEKPSSETRPPELEKKNDEDRSRSYKAAHYAMKQNGATKTDFVKMATKMFFEGRWDTSYGGKPWGKIGEGWQSLKASENLSPRTKQSIDSMIKPMSVAIDHVYDLQHNTDTVFNKLKSYYSSRSGYGWIKTALDHKANVKSYHDLLQHTSGTVKSMAMPVLYNRLGTAWDSTIKKESPQDQSPELDKDFAKEIDKSDLEKAFTADGDKSKGKPSEYTYPKFSNGDVVKCINVTDVLDRNTDVEGLTLGKTYKIDTITQGGKYVTLYNDDDSQQTFLASRFESVHEKPAEKSKSGFEVGDTIVCINDQSFHNNDKLPNISNGNKYKVDSVSKEGNFISIIDDTGKPAAYNKIRFEKEKKTITEPVSFQKGDQVKHKITGHYGKVLEVIPAHQTGYGYPLIEVAQEDGQSLKWALQNTKLIEAAPTHGFKVDDVVQNNQTGKVGKILKIADPSPGSKAPGLLKVVTKDGDVQAWKTSNTDPHEEEGDDWGIKSPYKEGDKVVYQKLDGTTAPADVVEIKDPNHTVIKFPNGISSHVSNNLLSFKKKRSFKDAFEDTAKPKFNIGDKVKYVYGSGKEVEGIVVEPITSNPNKDVKVKFKRKDKPMLVPVSLLHLVSSAKGKFTDDKWDNDGFQLGEKVLYNKPEFAHPIMGTVMEVNDGDVAIKLPDGKMLHDLPNEFITQYNPDDSGMPAPKHDFKKGDIIEHVNAAYDDEPNEVLGLSDKPTYVKILMHSGAVMDIPAFIMKHHNKDAPKPPETDLKRGDFVKYYHTGLEKDVEGTIIKFLTGKKYVDIEMENGQKLYNLPTDKLTKTFQQI